MIYCKHFFGRTIKDKNGILYDYIKGCLVNENINDCGAHCKKFDPIKTNVKITTNSE